MSVEQATVSRAEEVAERLLGELLHPNEQLALFATETGAELLKGKLVEDLRKRNAGRLVLSATDLQMARYRAAYVGAGFQQYEFDDITYKKNDAMTQTYVLPLFNVLRTEVLPEFSRRHNRMRDEVNNTLVTDIAPDTEYDLSTSQFVTSPEDIKRVLVYDYENLGVCADMGMDLL